MTDDAATTPGDAAQRDINWFSPARFPFGKAPFWVAAVAVVSSLLLIATKRTPEERPDLVLAIFAASHKGAYQDAIPTFEKRHGVKVQLQLVDYRALEARLQNAILARTDVPDLVELEAGGSLGFFTRGPKQDVGFLDLSERLEKEGLAERIVQSRFAVWSAHDAIYALPHDIHPVMLVYRRDLVEELGIDVEALKTWDDFVEMGRRITRDFDGDGIIDRYAIDLPISGGWGLQVLMFQNDAQFFDAEGNVAFNSPATVETIAWYVRQLFGPQKIAYECGWGQSLLKAMSDGLALFYIAPDWRAKFIEREIPRMHGKLALMPLPAWEPGGRRTSVWGGTGLTISKFTDKPELAWELAKFLYFEKHDLAERFQATYIVPPFKDAWSLPAFDKPIPYYSNQPLGRLYANLADETPPVYSSPFYRVALTKVDEAYTRAAEYYKSHGERGFEDAIRRELARAEDYVERMQERNELLAKGGQ